MRSRPPWRPWDPTFAPPPLHPTLHLQHNTTPANSGRTPSSTLRPPPGIGCSSYHATSSELEASWSALGLVRGAGRLSGGDGEDWRSTHIIWSPIHVLSSVSQHLSPSLSQSVIQPFIILSAFLLSCLPSIIYSPIIYLGLHVLLVGERTHTHRHARIYIYIHTHA